VLGGTGVKALVTVEAGDGEHTLLPGGLKFKVANAGVAEVTAMFECHDIERAIAKVLTETDLEYGAATDYGLTLRQFKASHIDAVNRKTTVIIIGDGRSNYGNPEERILREIRERSRRLIWLNPESEAFWLTGDSEMRTYTPLCNEVRPCQNLNQLSDFIRELVL